MKTNHFIRSLGMVLTALFLLQTGCSSMRDENFSTGDLQNSPGRSVSSANNGDGASHTKYVFLFIGDGMGAAQVQLTSIYLQETATSGKDRMLSFLSFPVQTTVSTASADSMVTDSAAAGTALATGHKTRNGVIGKDASLSKSYQAISADAKQSGMKVGILSSVAINHATPAAFYAHQDSRNLYHGIALELGPSGFDYFGGGGFTHPRGAGGIENDAYKAAEAHGYRHVSDTASIRALAPSKQKVLATYPSVLSEGEMPYEIDRVKSDLSLSQFTAKGIELLLNDRGFFIMVEGGKIDWACHDNDAATVIHEVSAFEEAINQALRFYRQHESETLILVTADHETGGLSLGNNTLPMALHVSLLQNQRVSLGRLSEKIQAALDRDASFDEVLKLICESTGLGDDGNQLSLTEMEIAELKRAYSQMISLLPEVGLSSDSQLMKKSKRSLHLGTLAIDILNRKTGLNWGSLMHTGIDVPLYVIGAGASEFTEPLDNTDIPNRIRRLLQL